MQLLAQMLRQLSYWSVLLPLIIGLMFVTKLSKESKWILLLVALATVPQTLIALWPKWKQLDLVFNIYTVFEFAIMTQVFGKYLKDKISRNLFYTSIPAFAVIGLYLFLNINFLQVFVSQLVCVSNMIYLLWILALIRECYVYNLPFFEKEDPFTYYLCGLIPYASATMIIFLLFNKIKNTPDYSPLKYLFTFHDVLNSLLYIMFAIGIVVDIKKAKVKIAYTINQ